MTDQHSYPLRVLEDDQTVPPRPEAEEAEFRRATDGDRDVDGAAQS
jgi:hypothetical protein